MTANKNNVATPFIVYQSMVKIIRFVNNFYRQCVEGAACMYSDGISCQCWTHSSTAETSMDITRYSSEGKKNRKDTRIDTYMTGMNSRM